MFLINSTACSFEVSISDAHCHVLVVQSCLPYLYPGTEKVSLPHHLPIPRRTHPSSAVSALIYVDGEGEGEAGEGRKEGRPLLRACVHASKLRRWSSRGRNKLFAEISPLHCLHLPCFFHLVRPSVRVRGRFTALPIWALVGRCYAMSLPFPSPFRPAHGDGQVHVFESYEEQDAKSYNPWLLSIIGCLITLFKSRWH